MDVIIFSRVLLLNQAIRFSELPLLLDAINATADEEQMQSLKSSLHITDNEQYMDVELLLELMPTLNIITNETADTLQVPHAPLIYVVVAGCFDGSAKHLSLARGSTGHPEDVVRLRFMSQRRNAAAAKRDLFAECWSVLERV